MEPWMRWRGISKSRYSPGSEMPRRSMTCTGLWPVAQWRGSRRAFSNDVNALRCFSNSPRGGGGGFLCVYKKYLQDGSAPPHSFQPWARRLHAAGAESSPLAASLLLEGSREKSKALEPRCKPAKLQGFRMVGETGFEPATPWSRTKCSTRLSHSPIRLFTSPGLPRADEVGPEISDPVRRVNGPGSPFLPPANVQGPDRGPGPSPRHPNLPTLRRCSPEHRSPGRHQRSAAVAGSHASSGHPHLR